MNTTYTTTATGEAREAIVDKLHGALAAFRRERDELHRKKELAVERLQLVKEEQQAIEKTVHAMQEKLNQLNKSGSEEAKKDLEQMEKDMDQVHRTVSPWNEFYDILYAWWKNDTWSISPPLMFRSSFSTQSSLLSGTSSNT